MVQTTEIKTAALYSGVEFYAQLHRKNGRPTGTIVVVNPEIKNGTCVLMLACAPGHVAGKDSLPVQTWARPSYLTDYCRKVTEEQAREIDAAMMAFIDKHHRSEEFRTMYEIEEKKPGRSTYQRADVEAPTHGADWVGHKFYELYGH